MFNFFLEMKEWEVNFLVFVCPAFDDHDLINKAVGGWVREAGKRDKQKLLAFLDNFLQLCHGQPYVMLLKSLIKRNGTFI